MTTIVIPSGALAESRNLLLRSARKKQFYVYMMASRSRTLYTGVTSDLPKRVYEHKNGLTEGFTSKYNVTRLVYFEEYTDSLTAIEREKQIKRWSRAKKVALIEAANPRWSDLSEGWYSTGDGTKADPSTSVGMTGVRSRDD